MRIAIDSFRGEVPRLTPRALPDGAAQIATNARVLSGDLEAWRQFALTKSLSHASAVRTIFLLRDRWLSWTEEVDVSRGVIPGDTTYRTYLTCPALYDRPQFTTYELATTGAEPYPVQTRPLGVPGPSDPPTVTFEVSAAADSNIALTNPGAEEGTTTGWTVSSGSLVVVSSGDVVGLNAQAGTRFFSGGSVAASEAYQEVDLVAENVISGQGLKLAWQQASGAAGSTATMGIEFYSATATLISSSFATEEAVTPANTWDRREITVPTPSGATTARLVQRYTRVGAGPALDAYIDAITLASTEFTTLFDGSSLVGWSVSSQENGPGSDQWREVVVDSGAGWAPPSIRMRGDEFVPQIHRDFSTDTSPAITLTFDFQQEFETGQGLLAHLFASDTGRGAAVFLGPGGVAIFSCSGWDDGGNSVQTLSGTGLPISTRYTVTLSSEQLSQSEARVTVRVVNGGGTVLVDDLKANIPIDGPNIAFKGRVGALEGRWYLDNIAVTVAAPQSPDVVQSTATAYIFTYVNDLGEESAPSEASSTVLRPDGVDVTITTPTSLPTGFDPDYNIVAKRIYRAATGATGSIFRFVAEIPLATADYVDALTDAQLGEALESEDWDLPPDDLEGIRALPNGIMVGFRRNQLCFSAQNRPHAWPVAYRLPTDSDIVAITNVDTTVIVGTEKFLYTASGTSPESYSMSTPGAAQACISKRSMANLYGGAVFASPDGLMLATGPTQVRNLTEAVFTREQWQAIKPESILGVVHDDTYFMFYDNESDDPAGCAIDAKANGFGVIELAFHATAAHTDPLTDALQLVLSGVDEPSAAYLPLASTAPTPNGRTIYQFDGGGGRMAYRWRGRLNLLPRPAAFQMAKVQALDYTNLVLRIYADDSLLMETTISSARPFTLPMLDDYEAVEIEFVGTSTVRRAQLVEDVEEFT